ncbi:hypothetical protein [Sphingomonas sanxanigenens]|uniref:Uncharacterized protein n=1 Tax=Sphingomonas sanxanigenens DSM 19645 = NX02 TaxID=1123269 RepID=W0AJ41_9SPHN|nr:hypothetical protein [Sphingomonas sanxanigenens]AHE56318.1 hypothetical protein NX02_23515 [Sphingomonas sanxanigenens DSM 19645 = NX02]
MMLFALPILMLQAAAPPPQAPKEARCFVKEKQGAYTIHTYIGARACEAFDPPREIAGVWVNQFEGSSFHEGATSLADLEGRPHRVWLSMDKDSVLPVDFKPQRSHVYRLRFVGRTATDMNRKPLEGYGHFGVSPGMVLVDRLVGWEDLGPAAAR